uniref:PDZ domain-containing protein n=1 Tax=Dunaliella tertiolecta TaxID=3047 RepID=A0A7S3VP22_DUNTE
MQAGRCLHHELLAKQSSCSGNLLPYSRLQNTRKATSFCSALEKQDQYAASSSEVEKTIGRRSLHLGMAATLPLTASLLKAPSSQAEPLTLEQVTPKIVPTTQLTSREEQLINVFDTNTYSVVNIFDITIRGRAAAVPEVDVPEGNGSGVVWDQQGNIVTNYHVLGSVLKGLGPNALKAAAGPPRVARVTVLGTDGVQQTYDGVLVGADKSRDLAVVKINAPPEQLRPVTLGQSAPLRVGQQVLAIGCPFGFDHTLTTGVVSGLNREVQSVVGSIIPGGIQTDAAINPGNSGGPLLDSAGHLVGINTAIFTNTGTSVGVGFAIPGDMVTRIVPQLISNGRVVRPSLGIQVASPAVAARLNVTDGALVQLVVPGGAAQRAGLLPTRRGLTGIITGDVIKELNGVQIKAPPDLSRVLDELQIGQQVPLKVLRAADDKAQQEVTLLAELASE